jgi:plasmid maintenance system antidote protein VapI
MITEKFSKTEKKKLKLRLGKYGAIKQCADKTGIHRSTITRILKTGEATADIALRMRNYIDGFVSRMYLETSVRKEAA